MPLLNLMERLMKKKVVRKNRTTKQKFTRARTYVICAMRLAHKNWAPENIDFVTQLILDKLPANLFRKLDTRRENDAMLPIMKLALLRYCYDAANLPPRRYDINL
jgi:uncharacterized protein (DUF924 family)